MSNSDNFPLFPSDCRSLLCQYLTRDMFENLKDLTTANGYSFQQLINSGVVNPDSSVGVYAGDEESYSTFASLFDPVIGEYHGFSKTDNHISNFKLDDLNAPNPDPAGDYIISTRIRVARNLAEFPLGPMIGKKQRNEVEQKISKVLDELTGKLTGKYHSLQTLSEAKRNELIADHFLFKAGDRFLEAAGLNREWPLGRGIYHNDEKTFLLWVNEEDHLRIISMQPGGNIDQTFTRLCDALEQFEGKLRFSCNDHLGYLTSCPTNLGTAMRCSVHIKLPGLANKLKTIEQIADRHYLQIRGIHGEHSASEGSVFDISNRRRLGVTEVDCVQDLYNGVVALIAEEKRL